MMERLKIAYPVITEGKYDKIKLESLIEAHILCTDGFGIFKDTEKQAFLRRLCDKTKIIVLTDADGAGLVIRNFINSILPKERLIHLYIPQCAGKEKRKATPAAEGFLGVEGLPPDLLRSLFAPFADNGPKNGRPITKADFYADGLSGHPNSAVQRAALCARLGLPPNLSAGALLDALNLLYGYEAYRQMVIEKSLNSEAGRAEQP